MNSQSTLKINENLSPFLHCLKCFNLKAGYFIIILLLVSKYDLTISSTVNIVKAEINFLIFFSISSLIIEFIIQADPTSSLFFNICCFTAS